MAGPGLPQDRPRRHGLRTRVTKRAEYEIDSRRRRLAERAFFAISPTPHRTILTLPFPPAAANESRYGHGKPSHPRLRQMLARGDADYAATIASFERYRDALDAIPAAQGDPLQPHWHNAMLYGLDGITLYCFMRERAPASYIEVGSGNSTLFVDRARRDGDISTHITSIDPVPRRDIDAVCDNVVREPLESVSLDVFAPLKAGDIVYFDCSHRVFMNSCVTAFFLDVLPELPPGVLVGVHDVYLPDDYKTEHHARWWSEQYILATLLLGEPDWLRTVLPCWYVSSHPELGDRARALAPAATHSTENPHGMIFWMETQAR